MRLAVLRHFPSSSAIAVQVHMLPSNVCREAHAHFRSVIEVGRLSLARTFGAIYMKSTVHLYQIGFMHAFSYTSSSQPVFILN